MKVLLMSLSYLVVFTAGFGTGVYLLPILSAPPAPTTAQVRAAAAGATYRAQFRRDLRGSDLFHWGEGEVSLGPVGVALEGRLAPGPAYRLYLTPGFVEDEAEFKRLKPRAQAIGEVRTFENFVVPLPTGIRLEDYDTVVVWCESFSRFITAAKYR